VIVVDSAHAGLFPDVVAAMTDLLANPIWHSLSTRHSDLAQGNHLAKRYPEAVGPLSGIPEQSTECLGGAQSYCFSGRPLCSLLR